MRSEEIEFIRDLFYSDLDIEIDIKDKEGNKGIIILRSNAYYFDGERHKGDKRQVIYDSDLDEDPIYDFLSDNFKEYFYGDYSLERILWFLEALEVNGFILEVA